MTNKNVRVGILKNALSKQIIQLTVDSLEVLKTSKDKKNSPCWYYSNIIDRQVNPTHLFGIVFDWDDFEMPALPNGILHYVHMTHSNKWRIIIPFKEPYKILIPAKTFHERVREDLNLDEHKIDRSCFSYKRAYYFRPVDNSLIFIEGYYYNVEHIIPSKIIQPKEVKEYFGEKITTIEEGRKIFIRINTFYEYYKYEINWKNLKTEKCIFSWHDNDKKDISFNPPTEFYPATIYCYHSTCVEKLNMAIDPYQPDKRINNITVKYLTMGVINGIYSLYDVESTAFVCFPKFTYYLEKLNFELKYVPKKDINLWIRIMHENIIYHHNTLKIYDYDKYYYKEIHPEILKAKYDRYIGTYYSYKTNKECNYYVDSILRHSKGIMYSNYNDLKFEHGLNLNNGILLFKYGTFRLIPHTNKYFFTYKMEYNYDEEAKCRRWIKTLNQYFEHDIQKIELLQEFFGYSLIANRSYEKFMILYGKSRGGKNTIIETLMSLVPSESFTLTLLCNPKERESIVNKHVLFLNEVTIKDNVLILNELKKLSSTDPMIIRPLYKHSYTTSEIPKLIMSFNEIPENLKIDKALKNRILSIKFLKSFDGREDIHLKDKLKTELSGILNWALKGYVRLIENKKFTDNKEDTEELYNIANDDEMELEHFITEKKKIKSEWLANELYIDFVHENGNIMTSTSFGRKLKDMNIIKKRNKNGHVYEL